MDSIVTVHHGGQRMVKQLEPGHIGTTHSLGCLLQSRPARRERPEAAAGHTQQRPTPIDPVLSARAYFLGILQAPPNIALPAGNKLIP